MSPQQSVKKHVQTESIPAQQVEVPRAINLIPLDRINGFDVRPGLYESNGATALSGAVNFTVCSQGATSIELLLFKRRAAEPYAVLPFPEHYRIGNVYSMIVFGLEIGEFEYAYRVDGPYNPSKGLIFDKTRYLLDPYAKAVVGQSQWADPSPHGQHYRARVVKESFDWESIRSPLIPMEDLIIYELHVRGFTMDPSSGVVNRGTFAGLMEKLPYLQELGVNAIELMPIFEFDEMLDYHTNADGEGLYNYWGYNPVSFFAPNSSYTASTEHNREGTELKRLIRACKQRGIEVYLDVVFNHTAEGNERGPFFSFKGFDNNVYYMLTPDGYYQNFSGCGNSLNCNHPIVHQMIVDCLRYWVTTYRVDGFRFDLASILGRAEDGSPMNEPPLLQSLAFDPILADVKLIAEAWDAGGLYQVGTFPAWNRWAEWNGRYRDDMRRYLKGDAGMAQAAALRMMGSRDIYPDARTNASVNFITCHDGFTLNDLFAYNQKHNERNGWDNTDGANDNNSWNCGVEGPTSDPGINALRRRMVRNAFALLMCSRGTPMFLAGDEFGNTQFGNNNAYCQDNITSWLDWSLLEKNRSTFRFFQSMIRFRKEHRVLRANLSNGACGFPDVSIHGVTPWKREFDSHEHYIGVLFAGWDQGSGDQLVYVASNAYWDTLDVELPRLPDGMSWHLAVDTWNEEPQTYGPVWDHFTIRPRSVMVFIGRR